MRKYRTRTERATILKELTKEQRNTLFTVVGKRYRSYFAGVLAKYKETRNCSFYRYIDHGKVRKDITCECGRPLRHQYILVNSKTKEKRTIGCTHLIEELHIPESIAKDVLRGIYDINYDLDELLLKYYNGWELPAYLKKNISKITMPNDIERLLTMDLPLLSRQLDLLYSKLTKLNSKRKEQKFIYVLQENAGFGGDIEYEIKNEEIYNVLIGETDFMSYIHPFRKDIEQFLGKQKRYTPVYDIIKYLVSKGLPNELMYGQHALTKHFIRYLSHRKNVKEKIKDDGVMYYKY